MKLKIKTLLKFKKLKPANKPGFGTKVINGLSANAAVFPDLPVKINELQIANDAVVASIPLALTGNRESIAALKNVIENWNNVFGITASYVNTVADGDAETILKAGFDPSKGESIRKDKPGAIENFIAHTNGFKNAVVAGTGKGVPGAVAFGYIAAPQGAEITANGNMTIVTVGTASIYFVVCTQKQTELYNLPEGAPYTITMFAVNAAGTGPGVTSQTIRPQ